MGVFIVSFGCPGQYDATRERTQARKRVNAAKPAPGHVRGAYRDNMLRRAPSTWALTGTFQRPVFSAVWGVHPMSRRHDCPTISARDDAGARDPSYENDDNARQRWRAKFVAASGGMGIQVERDQPDQFPVPEWRQGL